MLFGDLLERFPLLIPWLERMPDSLKGAFSVRSLPPGYLIHQKDTLLETVGVLCDGTLKVVNEFDTGNTYMIEHNHAVNVIGDVTVLAGYEKTSVSIETVTECTVVFFSRADFEEWLERDPQLLRRIARGVARKLYNSSYHHGAELFYSSPRLLLEFLRRYTEDRAPDTHGMTRIAQTRQQLSEQLGMLPKTVDRTIKKLRDAGLVSTERGKICVDSAQREAIARRLAEWIE